MKGSLCWLAETSFLWRDTAMRIRERFNPRAPCGARPSPASSSAWWSYFNPRAPCGARLAAEEGDDHDDNISTHAPLAGRDHITRETVYADGISTHAPLAGRDHTQRTASTCSFDFNPRAPCGARRPGKVVYYPQVRISTHAPLAGRDMGIGYELEDEY